jgi:MOSC domain-containing protein YiiM
MRARLVSVQVGTPRLRDREVGAKRPLERRWLTAFVKHPVTGPVRLGLLSLRGDRVADKIGHGGPEVAVLAYSADHYPGWRAELGIAEMGPGGFAENFTISGQDERTVFIGDVYRVGGATVQVSQPRGPCYKISYRWKRPDLLGRCEASGRHGWYLRVLEEGMVEAGDAVDLVERPHPEWTVRRAADVYRRRRVDREDAYALAACEFYASQARERILSGR